MKIGEKLRTIRLQHNLSQRELAKRSGVTNRTISLIEKNEVSPSVGSLKKVLDALSLTMADFFAMHDEKTDQQQFYYPATEQPNVGSGGLDYFLIGSGLTDKKLEILREVMPAGSDTGSDFLSHDGEEGGIVITGQVVLTVDGSSQTLSAGDGYYFSSRRQHRFQNMTEQDVVLLSVCTPTTF